MRVRDVRLPLLQTANSTRKRNGFVAGSEVGRSPDWHMLVSSERVGADEVVRLRRFGQELVLFRDAHGELCVADAYCPHMGADLGGGSVVDGELRCPFHAFRFDVNGDCAHVPRCDRAPARLRLRTFETCERDGSVFIRIHPEDDVQSDEHAAPPQRTSRYPFRAAPDSWYQLAWSDEGCPGSELSVAALGTTLRVARAASGAVQVTNAEGRVLHACEANTMIFVYHHAHGAPPGFVVPEIPEASSDAWIAGGRIERTFRSHVQEIVENSIDVGHYHALHGFVGPTELESFEASGPSFDAAIATKKRVFGVAVPGRLRLAYTGMGFGIGRMELPVHVTNVVTCLPVDEEHIRMRFTIFVRVPKVPVISRALAALLRWHLWHDVEGELPLFESKRYLERPALVPGDGPILKIRSWCRQFYDAERAGAV